MAIEIYGLFDARNPTNIRYIGKANNSAKRLKSHMLDAKRRNTPVYCWINSVIKNGGSIGITHLGSSLKENWQEFEKQMIKQYRINVKNLLNVADGGDMPLCPRSVSQKNGKNNAKNRDKRLWRVKKDMGIALKKGWVRESTKVKLREIARLYPKMFGEYANI